MISSYFEEIEKLITEFPFIVSSKMRFETIDTDRGYFRISLKLFEDSELHLFEYIEMVDNKPKVIKYRYHWQDKNSKLVKRWDNAKHHPELKTFPHHVHEKDGIVEPCFQPKLSDILMEVSKHIGKRFVKKG